MSNRPVARQRVDPPGKGRGAPNGRPPSDAPAASRRNLYLLVGAAIVVVAVLLIVALGSGGSDTSSDSASGPPPDPAAVLAKVIAVPDSVANDVGVGSALNFPAATSATTRMKEGKPQIVYVGAEYCPFCAAERWAMVMALSRFGTFSTIGLTHSATADVFPDTQTFSFHGSAYTSEVISFSGTEMQSNRLVDGKYASLDPLPADVEPLMPSNAGFPFVDFAGRFVLSGATYDPGLLQAKSADAIADALGDPANPIAKGIVGSANVLTAAICVATEQLPAAACTSPGVVAAAKSL